MSSNIFTDLRRLIADCGQTSFSSGGRSGPVALALALLVGVLCYLLCHKSTKL
jgi:hypothetical protein